MGLSLSGGRGRFGTESRGTGSAVLGLWVEQLASAPDAHPPEVSGVGAPPGFQVWAPNPLICMRATGLQVSTPMSFFYTPYTLFLFLIQLERCLNGFKDT